MFNRKTAKEKAKTLIRQRSFADYFGFAGILIVRALAVTAAAMFALSLVGMVFGLPIANAVSRIYYMGFYGFVSTLGGTVALGVFAGLFTVVGVFLAVLAVETLYQAGMVRAALRTNREDKKVRVVDIALAGDRLGRAWSVNLWITLFLIGWNLPGILLAFIGSLMILSSGIGVTVFGVIFIILSAAWCVFISVVKSCQYRFALHISEDKRDLSALDCVRESKELTSGHVGELFITDLSFLGWDVLSQVFLISVFTVPYRELTYAALYEQLNGRFKAYDPRKMEWLSNGPVPVPTPGRESAVIVISGEYSGAKFNLEGGEELRIGRDPKKANLVLSSANTSISGLHCSIRYNAAVNSYIVTDFSTNGTFINNEQIPREVAYSAAPGSVVRLAEGSMLLRLN